MPISPSLGGREKLLRAAFDTVRERGVKEATTKEIARRAEVSEGAIYHFFESKEHLIAASVIRIIQKMTEPEFPIRPAHDLHRAVRVVVDLVWNTIDALAPVWMDLVANRALRVVARQAFEQEKVQASGRQLQGYFRTLQHDGIVRKRVSADLIAWLITGTIVHYRMLCELGNPPLGVDAFLSQLTEVVARSLRPN